jgi:hypothetical protein
VDGADGGEAGEAPAGMAEARDAEARDAEVGDAPVGASGLGVVVAQPSACFVPIISPPSTPMVLPVIQ